MLLPKWMAAVFVSFALVFTGPVAEAKKKVAKKPAKVSQRITKLPAKRKSPGYAKAASYMERKPASKVVKNKKNSKAKRKIKLSY